MRSVLASTLVLLLLVAARPARAADPAPPAAAPSAGSAEPAASPTPEALRVAPPPAPSSFDFDLLGGSPEARPVDPAFERAVGKRRLMLKVHQGLGIATWTTLAATAVVGQLDFNDRFRGGGDTGRYHGAHKGLAYGSAALFATAAAFSLLAPSPYEKRTEKALDTVTLHKISMGVAAAGMLAQVALGIAARNQAGSLRERDLAAAHQLLGYATLGAASAGAVVLLF
jgi:hypothetical protein